MNLGEEEVIRRWRIIIRRVQEDANRLQVTADALPVQLSSKTSSDIHHIYAQHVEALADHTVALNCLNHLIAQRLDGEG